MFFDFDSDKSVTKPWGSYKTICQNKYCRIKEITVKPWAKLSIQRHRHRRELWMFVSGVGEVHIETIDMKEQLMVYGTNSQQYFDISPGMIHTVYNPRAEDLIFIEVQMGQILCENDIERLGDIYKREPFDCPYEFDCNWKFSKPCCIYTPGYSGEVK